jgi:hypothetical protein
MPNFTFPTLMVVAQHPLIRPIVELDTKSLESMLPEIPHWVKNPDFDRVMLTLLVNLFLFHTSCILRATT